MSFTAKALGDLLYSYIDQSGTSGPTGDVTNASAIEKKWIALAMSQAVQEARKLNPWMFVQRPGIVLRAPVTGTITVTQYSRAVTLGTLAAPPNDGCTVRITGCMDNELNETATPGTYQLRRDHEGASDTVEATLWHDCWMAGDGASYEGALGEVRANGRLVGADYPEYQVRQAGEVEAVLCEQWASPFVKKIQTRLRFSPMPSAVTVVDAALILAAPTFAAADVISTEIVFQVPQQLDELLLHPLAAKKFMAMPVFRAPADTRKEINAQYADAVSTFRAMRGHLSADNRIDTGL